MSEITLSAEYEPRPIRFLELARRGEWRLKVYGIAAENDRPRAELVSAAKAVAFERLPEPAVTEDRYGVGFLIVHEGVDANFVLSDRWTGENMIHQDVFTSPLDAPTRLERLPDGPTACVWELYVLGFERQAWISTVLANPDGPDVDAYLGRRFNGAV